MECVLHEDNAGKMKANIIVEAAKLPTTPEADEIFRSRGITVLPDILTNAGGIVVSFFEWTHRICNKVYRDERNCIVYLRHAYRDVVNRAAREKVPCGKPPTDRN